LDGGVIPVVLDSLPLVAAICRNLQRYPRVKFCVAKPKQIVGHLPPHGGRSGEVEPWWA